MNEPIDFTKNYELEVEVFDDELGELGKGTLFFGEERWTHVVFNWNSNYKLLPEGRLDRRLKAKTSSGAWFSLFNCKRRDSAVDVACVVAGDVSGAFKRIGIRYSDISEWYAPWQSIEGRVGDAVSWKNPVKHLATHVKTKHEEFFLTSESETSITRKGEDHVLHEHVLFCFEQVNGVFSSDDIQVKALALSQLLSILIGFPLSIVSVQVVCEDGSTGRAVFSTFKRTERDDRKISFHHSCFIQQQDIHDRWEKILNCYFNSEYRDISWARLAGMQRYDGFWEYRALGYVSLLDKYVDQRHKEVKARRRIAVPVGAKAKAKLEAELAALTPSLDSGQYSALMAILTKVFAHERDLEFAEKYRLTISSTDPDILKVIDISDKDFKLIKSVRNNIAHGKGLDLFQGDFQRIDAIVSKIILLMTYWAFLDFGLTRDDFLLGLRSTFHQLRYSAQPDLVQVDRLTQPESFFSVSKKTFDKIAGIKGIQADGCFTRDASGALEYAETYVVAYRNWKISGPHGMTTNAEIFGVAQERVKYLTPAYIECGEECFELFSAWIIDDV